jgi:2-oxoglutarate dehydrogenase E2 component (dihydrolipoamide succinyltransferase)
MSVEIRIPALGESIVDATIASWYKHEGDAVNKGDVLAELETDKINVEVTAEESGTLQSIVKQEGDTVAVGEVIGLISAGSATPQAVSPTPAATTKTTTTAVAPAPTSSENGQAGSAIPASSQAQSLSPARAAGRQRIPTGQLETLQVTGDGQRPPSPLASRIAAAHNVDISQVQSTGSHGRVMSDDVIHYIEQEQNEQNMQESAPTQRLVVTTETNPTPQKSSQPAPIFVPSTPAPSQPLAATPAAPSTGQQNLPANEMEERVKLSRRRQTIAQRLVETQHNAAMLTTFNEIDMSAVLEVRSRRKEWFKERHDVSLGFMSFFTKAVVGALKAFPRLNSEIQGSELILKHHYDIGIAVGAEEGLVVPVVRDADRKSFAEIEREIASLAKKARENKLSLADLQGGTFTITNGGVFGSMLSTPILNGPQAGILGMHKIEQRPIALNGQVVIHPMMYVALSYDHRIVDGREAVQFLVRVKELVEDPETLLLEG